MRLALICFLWTVSACAQAPDTIRPERSTNTVEFRQLADNVWLHTSYRDLPEWGPVPSNGLVVVTPRQVLLVDTAWDDDQTAKVLAWAQTTLGRPVTHAVFTHAHDDKMGGVGLTIERGIETYAHELSNGIAPIKGLVPAENNLEFDNRNVADPVAGIEIFYPGPGHTADNVVVYIVEHSILFGGCLIRPKGAKTLGNTADSDIANWSDAVENVASRYPDASLVIPSHGLPGDHGLLSATIELARERQSRGTGDRQDD